MDPDINEFLLEEIDRPEMSVLQEYTLFRTIKCNRIPSEGLSHNGFLTTDDIDAGSKRIDIIFCRIALQALALQIIYIL